MLSSDALIPICSGEYSFAMNGRKINVKSCEASVPITSVVLFLKKLPLFNCFFKFLTNNDIHLS